MAKPQPTSHAPVAEKPVSSSKPVQSTADLSMQVKVYSPFQVFFDESARSISSVNDTGAFDILPHHHNFITLLKAGELVIQTLHGEQRIRISGGIMHVKADKVIVFLDV